MSSASLVVAECLSKRFRGGTVAIDSLSFQVEAGQVTGLVGPDGAGKTTLLRLIAGLLLPTEGIVRACGFDTRTELAALRAVVSYMPQRFGLYEDLTVAANLALHADLRAVIGEERSARSANCLNSPAWVRSPGGSRAGSPVA